MTQPYDPTNWRAADGFRALAIDIRSCAWCGEGFVRIRLSHKPHSLCSEKCRKENAEHLSVAYELTKRKD